MTNQTTDQQPQAVGIAYLAPLSSSEFEQGRIVSIYETEAGLDDPQKLVSVPYLHLQSFGEWPSNLRDRQLPASKCSTVIVGMSSKVPCWFVSDSEDPLVTNKELRGKFFWKTTPPKKLRQLAKESGQKSYGPMIKKEILEKLIEDNPDSAPKYCKKLMRQEALTELPEAKMAQVSLWAHVWELRVRACPSLRSIIDKLGTKTFLFIRLLKDVFTSMSSAALIIRLFFFNVDNLIQWLIWGIIAVLILIFFAIPKTINYFKLAREMQENRQISNGSSLTDFWRDSIIDFCKFKRTSETKGSHPKSELTTETLPDEAKAKIPKNHVGLPLSH